MLDIENLEVAPSDRTVSDLNVNAQVMVVFTKAVSSVLSVNYVCIYI